MQVIVYAYVFVLNSVHAFSNDFVFNDEHTNLSFCEDLIKVLGRVHKYGLLHLKSSRVSVCNGHNE
jgi:hypothetical protein